jgi:hypothetical protein
MGMVQASVALRAQILQATDSGPFPLDSGTPRGALPIGLYAMRWGPRCW